MKTVKKNLMRFVKFGVGLFPAATRKRMRQSIWLHNLYSRSLQKSGLFYGFPSPHKLQKLFVKAVAKQSVEIEKISKSVIKNRKFNCLIVLVGNIDEDIFTIKSLSKNYDINAIFTLGTDVNVKRYFEKNSCVIYQPLMRLCDIPHHDKSLPLLILRGGDSLHRNALNVFEYYLQKENANKLIYCDIDSLDKFGQRHLGEFYPAWNPDLQLTTGYVKTGVVINDSLLVESLVDFTEQDYGYSVIAIWIAAYYLDHPFQDIDHISLCLVHQRLGKSTIWYKEIAKLNRNVFDSKRGANDSVATLKWQFDSQPLVTLIIPTRNAKELVDNCISSIINKTSYQNFEILLVDNNSDELDALAYFEKLQKNEPKVNVLYYPHAFNYSAINNYAVSHARGTIIGLINNDIKVISSTWLEDMVSQVQRSDIGCVGAKLLYPDTRIQHAGVVLGYGGGAGHAHKYFPRYHSGYLNRLIATNNFSAVTAACLLVKKDDFDAVNGLNEQDLSIAFNDVDFCLRIRSLGRRNLFCAEAELFHYESISRGADDTIEKRLRFEKELDYLQQKWADIIENDPAYNPNLTLRHENFSIKLQ